jgi:hypothetical protein
MVNSEWRFAGCASATAGEEAETTSNGAGTINMLRHHFLTFVRLFIAVLSIDVLFFLCETPLDLGDQLGQVGAIKMDIRRWDAMMLNVIRATHQYAG